MNEYIGRLKKRAALYQKWSDLVRLCGSEELSLEEVKALVPLARSYSRALIVLRAQVEAPGGFDIALPVSIDWGIAQVHDFLCHADGTECEDGCDDQADSEQLRRYEAMP